MRRFSELGIDEIHAVRLKFHGSYLEGNGFWFCLPMHIDEAGSNNNKLFPQEDLKNRDKIGSRGEINMGMWSQSSEHGMVAHTKDKHKPQCKTVI